MSIIANKFKQSSYKNILSKKYILLFLQSCILYYIKFIYKLRSEVK